MSDRETELDELVDEIADVAAVADAFVAKGFTDQIVVIDRKAGEGLPGDVVKSLRDHGLDGVNAVYATTEPDRSAAGAVGESIRDQFVDTETRSDHQSYVVD